MQRLLSLVGAGRTLLAPTAEIAAGILDRIEQTYLAQGREVWPTPQIRDFAGWARQQYEAQCFTRASAPRILEDIEERQIWREVIGASAIASEFLDTGGAARAARRAVRAMHDHGIAPQALQDFPGLESTALLQWIDGFDERCRQLQALSADRIVHLLDAPAGRPVPIDSSAWRPSVLQWLNTHADPPLPPMAVPDSADAAQGGRCMRLFKSFDAEMAACADWAREARARHPGFRGWVYVASLTAMRSSVSNAFDSALAPNRFSMQEFAETPVYAIAGGTPLADFEPVRIALSCLSSPGDSLPFDQFSALLRAPALQSEDADACAAARLDRVLRTQAPSEAPLISWLELAQRAAGGIGMDSVQAITRLHAMRQCLVASAAPQLLSRWASVWIEALEAGPWMQRAHWSSTAYQAAESFRELIGRLARADVVFGPLRPADALRTLSTAARESLFQPQTGVAPVWITGQPADPWLAFDGLWVTGGSAQAWPPPPDPLPLLPVQLQRRHGVPGSSAALQLQRAMDLQTRWLQRAPTVVFSCSSETDTAALPSALLRQYLNATPTEEGVCDPLWRALAAGAAPLERFVDENGPGWTAQEKTRGTRSLREQSLCPFRGFAASRLRADPLEFPQPGFNALERGVILHESLQFIWARLRSSGELARLDEAQCQNLIRDAVLGAVGTAVTRRDPGAHWSLREVRRLQRLLPNWLALERRREPFDVVELEAGHHFDAADLRFDLRVDRIDRLQDASLVLLDYKSGEVARDWAGERMENPQLPLYALSVRGFVAALAYARVNVKECRFFGLSERAHILPQVDSHSLEGSAGMAGQLSLWSARLAPIAAELKAGAARVDPVHYACRSCSLHAFCRIAGHAGGELSDD